MASIVNTNMMSLNAQKSLASTNSGLQTAMERLSSGLRVNSSKDDSAGLAIANRMTSQIRGMTVAQRNANDGISMAQVAEGSMSTITDTLQRMRDLALQAANSGAVGDSDKANLQKEFAQLKEEISRIITNTEFNGINVLNGDVAVLSAITATAAAVSAITAVASQASVASSVASSGSVRAAITAVASRASAAAVASSNNGGTAIASVSAIIGVASRASAAAITATRAAQAGAVFQIGANTTVDNQISFGIDDLAQVAGMVDVLASGASIGSGVAQSSILGVVTSIDTALVSVDDTRAGLGAIQNRFSATITNLANSIENQSAARSRIMDADFAVETANLSRSQILQQAGTAMLGQANAAPQSVLGLLQ